MKAIALLLGLPLLSVATANAQAPGADVRQYISVDAPVFALANVRLIDGTGGAAKEGQTIVVENGRIGAVGDAASVRIPAGAQVLDLAGHTVIPGIIGLHDHAYYNGRTQLYSYPRLFLGAGVTTIRTTGSYDPYVELNMKRSIDAGTMPGPTMYVTGPYLQGDRGQNMLMTSLKGAEDARRVVRYWADEGVTWFKAYTHITRDELAAAVDEAHRHGMKVTAHLCSVGFREAAALGIDNLEHGLLTNTEYFDAPNCNAGPDSGYATLDVNGPEVQRTIRELVDRGVALTSTLAVFELYVPSRMPVDPRVLDALHPDARTAVQQFHDQAKKTPADSNAVRMFRNHMAFERAFVAAGGLLGAGSDPCCVGVIAGYADQRNFEILVEAGFTTEQAVRIMTANGARVLGTFERVGTIEAGKDADMVVLAGDLTRSPQDIRNTVTVFRRGIGYDAKKLIASVAGRVGTW